MNLQGACDVKGRYLDVTIGHPGSTSVYLAFVTSKFHAKLETPGFLAPGLVLYGDNAHVCNDRMVTPFKNVSSGSKGACNFYQLQIRIRVECSFSMLVHRWTILRRPLPYNIPLRKIPNVTCCLWKLNNYCIDENEVVHCEQTKINEFYSSITWSLPVVNNGEGNLTPNETLGEGNHSDDYDRWRVSTNNSPREKNIANF